MRFLVKLQVIRSASVPIDYQNELSDAILRILEKNKLASSRFDHLEGYHQHGLLFTFSHLNCAFKLEDDYLWLLNKDVSFYLTLHLPPQMEAYVRGLFHNEKIILGSSADTSGFKVKAINLIQDPLTGLEDDSITSIIVRMPTPAVILNEDGATPFESISPDDKAFCKSVVESWRKKIALSFDENAAQLAFLSVEKVNLKTRAKFRQVAIRLPTGKLVTIRGWFNFHLKIMARRKYLTLLLNAGVGAFNSYGFGYLEVADGK